MPRLRPQAVLARLQPVKTAAWVRRLRQYERLGLALDLIRQHFPAELAGYTDVAQTDWWTVLAHLINLAEAAGWFEVNWPVLNEAWAYRMENPAEEGGDHLAVFVHYIPVQFYGFNHQGDLLECPPMELLHTLLSACEIEAVSTELLVNADIYDALEEVWDTDQRQAAWERLHRIEIDPGVYSEPVRWLPELARWACHRSGNLLLDRVFDPYQHGPWLTWRHHVAEVKTGWQRARPVINQLGRLMNWYETDNGNLAKLADFLMTGDNDDELDW